jgi:hypothetical protein
MPESRSVDRCGELREQCQQRIFTRMDEHHNEIMDALSDLRVKVAEEKGAYDSQAKTPAVRRWSWREVATVIAVVAAAIGAAIAGVWKGMHG